MFYGALEKETCVSEVRAPVGSFVVLVKFDLLNPIRVLDLEALSNVYSDFSHFDPNYIEKRNLESFLKELVGEMSRPVMPHEEDREYIATQKVSEYLASQVEPRLHGIIFSSAQTGGGGRNVVLFNGACSVEAYEPRPGTGLRAAQIPRQPGIPPPGTERANIYSSELNLREQLRKLNGVLNILRPLTQKPKAITRTAYLSSTRKVWKVSLFLGSSIAQNP